MSDKKSKGQYLEDFVVAFMRLGGHPMCAEEIAKPMNIPVEEVLEALRRLESYGKAKVCYGYNTKFVVNKVNK
jgi:sugar-specific transcriptional regulator TrmB